MFAKVAGGIIGLGLIGTGGVAIAKPGWFGISKSPDWTPLSKDETTGDPYKSKFGGKHKNYLVGIKEGNKDWWEESYKKLSQDTKVTGAFQPNTKVKSGFSTATITPPSSPKTLNQVCEDAYKADPNSVKANTTTEGEFNEEHVWKYCSGLGGKPKTIQEANETNEKYKVQGTNTPIGKEAETTLISVFDKGNDKFWEIRNKEFKNEDNYGPIESGDPADAFFSTSRGKSIRDLCELAYQQTGSGEANSTINKPKKDKVLKYCSLDKQ